MRHLFINASFYDSNNTNKDTYTLCGKCDINPAYVLTYSFMYPVCPDVFILRDPGYAQLSYIYYGAMSHVIHPDNGWAWIYNSNQSSVQLPPPCYYDILALNHSNSISALAELVRQIAQKHKLDAEADALFDNIDADLRGVPACSNVSVNVFCELPESVCIRAQFWLNNAWYALYIYVRFCKGATNVMRFTVVPFNQNSAQITNPQICQSYNKNVLEAIENIVDSVQRYYNVKVLFDGMQCSESLIIQPVL